MTATSILVYSEKDSLRRELLGVASQKAAALGWQIAVAVVEGDPANASLGDAGADLVYPIQAAATESPECLVHSLKEIARQVQPALILIGATKLGMEAAAFLIEGLDAAYAPWAVGFEIDPITSALSADCMLYAGSGLAKYQFTPGLVVLTAAAGVFSPVQGAAKAGKLVQMALTEPQTRVEIVSSRAKASGSSSLEDAQIVLDVGQGIKQREDLAMVEALAGLLDGQLACTRPVSSDRDWFPDWLGLSGKKVKPDFCFCVGISGAIQHIVGIRDSRVIAAVNNDEGAAIFTQADYSVVADLYEFLPALAERIRVRGIRPTWSA
jgi:electron transfer flavoprotein alpha subunit